MISLLLVGRRDVRDLRDRLDDRALEFGLRILGVVDQIEAVRDEPRLERLAVARGERGAELGLVGVGGLVQVDVQQETSAQRRDQAQQRGRLCRGRCLPGKTGSDRSRSRSSDGCARRPRGSRRARRAG